MNWDSICFNIATLIAGAFVLDFGADKFIDHTVIVGQRLGISPTLIALLTAGAEYEELAVIVAAILQHRSPLAFGNAMGSAISNILGAFSLGLLCHPGRVDFDSSAKMYSVLLLSVTTLFVALAFLHQLNRVTGGILIGVFALYIMSIGYAIYRGITKPTYLSDSDNDDELPIADAERQIGPSTSENSPLLGNANPPQGTITTVEETDRNPPRPLYQHVFQLLLGLLALFIRIYSRP
ncbi:hypothetical protein DTO027B5_2909 [Paecilomyces variotii]|nr:hypothetical protein DTO027B3_6042 [Paecilomyces variotii]KAJ9335213.1 hypothetical protein DTO027B5_2909 [Paecilomyces variotii]